MRLPHRLRLVLATRPLAYWSLAIAIAAGTAAVVQRTTAGAAEARHQWGESRPTLVTIRAIAAGELVDATNTQIRAVPLVLRPDGVLEHPPLEPRPAAAPLAAGEIVTSSRIGRGGRSPVAALLPDGSRGVAMAIPAGLPLRTGDMVDVIGAAGIVTHAARIVATTDQDAVVAVAAADVAAAARAAADGDAVIVLSP